VKLKNINEDTRKKIIEEIEESMRINFDSMKNFSRMSMLAPFRQGFMNDIEKDINYLSELKEDIEKLPPND